jgi:hypothetical protein
MNMRIITIILAVLLCAGLLHAAETVRVITRENAVRQQCKFYSPVRAKVRYNDPLTVQSRSGDWYKVSFRGVSGCIHKSAVVAGTYRLSGGAGGRGGGASADEVSLAGKGFNPQVEAAYKGKHPGLSFRSVDEVERYKVPDETFQAFLGKGGLTTP